MQEFSSFGSFARHLEKLSLVGEAVTHHITEDAAAIVEKDAKAKIGHYQDYAGPFAAWAELAEYTKADRVAKGFPENEPLLRTGDLRDSITASVHGNEAVVGSDSQIALYQEVGTSRIPPRSFLGGSAFEAKLPIAESAAKTIVAWVSGLGWKRPSQLIKLP